MAIRLNIQGKLLLSSVMSLGFIVAVGSTGYIATGKLEGAAAKITQSGVALKSQMSADQAHDALRADVFAALLAGNMKDTAKEAAIKKDFDAHVAIFRGSLKDLEALPLDDSARQSLTKISPALLAYVNSAASVMKLAFTDNAAAIAKMDDFMIAFTTLETEMATLSNLIDHKAEEIRVASTATSVTAKATILAAILLSAAVLLVCGWLISRSIVRPIRRAVEIAQTVASGNLSSHIEVRGNDETAQLLSALKLMNESLVTVVGTVRQSSDSIATGSSQISTGNIDLSQRTEEQASNLQETATSMEEITAAVRNNATATNQAAQLARCASEAATKGGVAIRQVVNSMSQITDASKKINDIIGVIDGIAFKTNILALNAAVEAARAGDQGRGFAVVAAEVRTLAKSSAVAAKEIKELIQTSTEKIQSGTLDADDAGKTIENVVNQVQQLTQLIGEISKVTSEQTVGIVQVSSAVAQIDQATQQNSALVEQTAAAAGSLKAQAQQLVDAVAVFRLPARPHQLVAV